MMSAHAAFASGLPVSAGQTGRGVARARRAVAVLAVFLGLAGSAKISAGVPSAPELLSHLRKEHPRLLWTGAEVDELKVRIASDDLLKGWSAKIHARGQEILKLAPTALDPANSEHNLILTREVEERVRTLAFLYRLEGDRRYVDRAWQELDAPSQSPDWNPKHFLDVAEMTFAFAIAYDWLYDAWTPEQRTTLRQAIIRNGLRPAVANPWWKKVTHNWNLVCNGGIGIGALAVADEEPELAGRALQITLDSVPFALASYAPDGAWSEGIGYWDYATTFAVYYMASLESATGGDGGLSQFPGFPVTGLYPLQMTGPIDMAFNFGDAPMGAVNSPALFWLARKFGLPLCAAYQQKRAAPGVMDVLWYHPPTGLSAKEPPLGVCYKGIDVVCLRGSWSDPQAAYVGFKGGDNKANHGHLDLGTFVFDVGGYRFARQGGAESYAKPGYFDIKKQRWTYYRTRAEGTNTLVINPGPDPDQDIAAGAKIIKARLDGTDPFAVADLSPAYSRDARKVRRGVRLLGGRKLLVQDEITADKPAEVWWFMHTKAETDPSAISQDGRSVLLKGMPQGILLTAEILAPPNARFQVLPASPLPGTNPAPDQSGNPGVRKLAIQLAGVTETTIAVVLKPATPDGTPGPAPAVVGLDQW